MAGRDVNVELGNTDPPTSEAYERAARTLARLAVRNGGSAADLALALGAIGFLDAEVALEAAQSVSGAAPIDGHSGECSDRSASRPGGKSGGSREMCGKKRHYRTKENTRIRKDRRRACKDCEREYKRNRAKAAS